MIHLAYYEQYKKYKYETANLHTISEISTEPAMELS